MKQSEVKNFMKRYIIEETKDGRVIFDGEDLGLKDEVLQQGRGLMRLVGLCVTISGCYLSEHAQTVTASGLNIY